MKKYLSLILALILVSTSLIGCSSKSNTGEKSLEVDKDKVLKVWSFTDELKKPLEYFEEHYGIKTELTLYQQKTTYLKFSLH
ncbi:hypothetical protein [Caldisalinibacter kiritimatiensis]|uniref:Uncharacterized protein n=1 Tax=Caldisalinibacter kiritimatiensis TaxID=1304284 RepID=R1ATA2_9FIRM|nr:hypothetical protein [Caldisalinibacter kiritimatiensis]EOD00358.1 hypothetical protein L21TH_1596 [Caldisalinibacter kiritimatiensis]